MSIYRVTAHHYSGFPPRPKAPIRLPQDSLSLNAHLANMSIASLFDIGLHRSRELYNRDRDRSEFGPRIKSGSENRFLLSTVGGQTIDSFINSYDKHQTTPKPLTDIASEPHSESHAPQFSN
jgi:hypothetical protein